MKEVINVIKAGLSNFRGDAVDLIAENIATTLIGHGLAFGSNGAFEVTQERILNETNKDQFSDGYHTFEELYNFRKVYNVALFNEWASQSDENTLVTGNPKYDVHKSWRHNDGELCFGGGWFIVVAVLPTGQISNHYEAKDWYLFRIPETHTAKYEWDGHEAKDVLKRLMEL